MKTRSFFTMILILFLFSTIISSEIDIYDKSSGVFLETDLQEIATQAWEYYQEAEYETAARGYLEMLKFNITDSGSIYNLACCYGLLGQAELAAYYVDLAYKAGFEDIGHIRNDPDFNAVRKDSVFSNMLANLQELQAEKSSTVPQYFKTRSLLPYKLHVPEELDEEAAYPLLIGLHGFGDNPDNFFRIGENSNRYLYATPQAPYPLNLGKKLGYSWTLLTDDPELITTSWLESAKLVIALIEDIKADHNISQVYLLGFSQGAHLSYLTGLKYPDTITAAAPFGGWLPDDILTTEDIQKASDLRVFIGHGKEDRMVEFSQALRAEKVLSELGFDLKTEYFEAGHKLDKNALENAIDWMLETE